MTVAVLAVTSLRSTDLVIPNQLERELRRADEFIQLAVVVSRQLVDAAPPCRGHRTGIYLGTAFGPMAGNLAVLDDLVMGEAISPTLFSHSVFNAAAGYIARLCRIHGPALTLNSYGWPFFTALQTAWQAIREQELDHALVLQVETYAPLLTAARNALLTEDVPVWPAGATAWLLGRQGRCHIEHIEVDHQPCPPEARLARRENGAGQSHPLAALEELSSLINKDRTPAFWQATAPYGQITLRLRQGQR